MNIYMQPQGYTPSMLMMRREGSGEKFQYILIRTNGTVSVSALLRYMILTSE